MFISTTALLLLSILCIPSSTAVAIERAVCPTPTNTACQVLYNGCVALGDVSLTTPWANQACIAAAVCFDGGVDAMLAAATCAIRGVNAPAVTGHNVARLSSSLYTNIASGASSATTQNAVDFYYSTLSSVHSTVWPVVSDVISLWKGVQAWTGFCNQNIPFGNFADYLQWNGSPGTCSTVCSQPTDASCKELFSACLLDGDTASPWSDPACVLAATCFQGGVSSFANAFSCATSGGASSDARSYPRLSIDTFTNLFSGGNDVNQQAFVDSYYNELTCLQATDFPSISFVITNFGVIANWTGFSHTGVIPYQNFADYLTYYS